MNTKDTDTTATAAPEAPTVDKVKLEWLNDSDPDLSWLTQFEDSSDPEEQKYAKRDKARLESYGQSWEMLGCVAKAQVSYPCGPNGERRLEWLTSGGLWGIESDSDKAYMNEVESEQLSDLASHLNAFRIEISADELNELL